MQGEKRVPLGIKLLVGFTIYVGLSTIISFLSLIRMSSLFYGASGTLYFILFVNMVLGISFLILAYGLWKLKKWAWYTGIGLYPVKTIVSFMFGMAIVNPMIAISSSIFFFPQMILSAVILWYLWSKREIFGVTYSMKYPSAIPEEPVILVAAEEKVADIPMKEKAPDIAIRTDTGAEVAEVAANLNQERAVSASTAVNYQGTVILYKVKVENKLPKPISDIKTKAFVPDVFLLKEEEKTIPMLESNNARTVSFEIRPTGECGECNISGRINYYNNLTDKREEIEIPVKSVNIICPLLKVREISEEAWRTLVSSMVEAGENTKEEIPLSAKSLFNMVADIVKDMNLYKVGESVTEDGGFFRSVARFYGEGVKELKYAAQIEAIGGPKKSQLMLKAWAEREDALTGFYYKILDEIEKRVKIKDYIDDSIVQQFYHIGDRIGAVVKDSVVQRSAIGAGADKKCPSCGEDVSEDERFCPHCGVRL